MTRRWILLIASLPFAIALLLLAFKLFSLPIQAAGAQSAYARGDGLGAVEAAEPLLETNWFEPWIAHFDRGAGYAAAEYYVEAIDDFERALELAPEDKRCQVSINLALAWERLGDSYVDGGYAQGAVLLYETAEKVLAAAGPECTPPEQPPQPDERDADQERDDAEDRVQQKRENAEQQRDQNQNPDDPSQAEEREEQLEELQEQGEQSEQERENQDNRDRGEDSGGGFTDQPW